MKNLTLLFTAILLAISTMAQAPMGINYQTVIRDGDGNIMPYTELSLQMTIRTGAPDGVVVYAETHEATTNAFGLVNLVIGQGTPVVGLFSDIDWGAAAHFLETAIDLEGNGNYTLMGTTQFLSVPYALYSEKSGDTTLWLKNENAVYYNQGQVGVGTSQPDSSAKLDVSSTTQGFLPPRMTTEERDSIPNPAAGLIIFNTNTHCINFYNGEQWVEYGRDPMDTFECGQIFTDPRDKQQYRTVQIGEQCWFAQNLNVGTKINASQNHANNGNIEKFCYENVPANCLQNGGLYQWDEMMAYDTVEFTKGICPEDWHLPTQAEWQILFDLYGGAGAAGSELVTSGTSGFDALMNGQYNATTGFGGLNNLSTFWTSSGIPGTQASGFDIATGSAAVNSTNSSVLNGFGVRCLKGLPNRVDPNLKVIDTTVYRLISDSLEIGQGIYRYEIIGSRKAKDIITDKNIVFGTENDGYLRKVEQSTINGTEMTLTTAQATMEDAFIEAEFGFNSNSSGKGGSALRITRMIYLAPGVEISSKNDGFSYTFSNLNLYNSNNVTISIPQGSFLFDPAYNFDFKIKKRRIQRLLFAAENTHLESMFDLQLDVNGQISDGFETTISEFETFIAYLFPPTVVVISTKLIAKGNFSFDDTFTATTGYTNTNSISFGLLYENREWQKLWNLNSNTQLHPFNWSGNISFEQNLTIVPEISIKFYGVAGPYFNLPIWEKLEANLAVPAMNYDASFDVGLNGNLGADVTIFGKTLANYNKELFGFEKNLYATPAKLEMVSGNNQTGNANMQLPLPLKVKVTDSKGLLYIPAQVHFTIETGGGSLNQTDVMTDANGFAQTFWTLGTLAGEQTVKAEVLKADGSSINGSPVTFYSITNQATLTIITTPVTNVAQTTANTGGNITDDGGSFISARGVCWSISQNPTIEGSTTNDGTGTGEFISAITGLSQNTLYYVRAYATNSFGTAYGNEVSFTTTNNASCGMPFTDTRDGQSYETVLIGEQCWMAENLNIGTRINGGSNQTDNGTIEKYCYNNSEANCDVYGGLYQWNEMMQYITTEGAQGICPAGWHLPSDNELTALTDHVRSEPEYLCNNNTVYIAKALAATTNWNTTSGTCAVGNNLSANNATGFTGLPGGFRYPNGNFSIIGVFGPWWSSSETSTAYARNRILLYDSAGVNGSPTTKGVGFSVRCLRDL